MSSENKKSGGAGESDAIVFFCLLRCVFFSPKMFLSTIYFLLSSRILLVRTREST